MQTCSSSPKPHVGGVVPNPEGSTTLPADIPRPFPHEASLSGTRRCTCLPHAGQNFPVPASVFSADRGPRPRAVGCCKAAISWRRPEERGLARVSGAGGAGLRLFLSAVGVRRGRGGRAGERRARPGARWCWKRQRAGPGRGGTRKMLAKAGARGSRWGSPA